MDKETPQVAHVVINLLDGTHRQVLITGIHDEQGATYALAYVEERGYIRVKCEYGTWYEMPER